MMAYQFQLGNYEWLSIIQNPGGKYYTVLTDSELEQRTDDAASDNSRLVCRLTARELTSFVNNDQLKLFAQAPNGNLAPPV